MNMHQALTSDTLITGADLFDGRSILTNSAVALRGSVVNAIVSDKANLHRDSKDVLELDGGLLVPGFVDLQVNGGGGVMLNDDPCLETIQTICDAHVRAGTTSLLPTLITDTKETTKRAIYSAIEAQAKAVPGFLGLHLEGPHLSLSKAGAHDKNLIRHMTDDDLTILINAKKRLRVLKVTVACESVSLEQIKAMSEAGIIVSLGHSSATFHQAEQAAEHGARCVTHLYNAMSPLAHREPGLVGAALTMPKLYTSLIVDDHHISTAALQIAVRAKQGIGKLFLVSDAMAPFGTDTTHFTLNGRTITRDTGRLTLEDGTLAGADINLISAMRILMDQTGLQREEVLRMASLYPANCVGVGDRLGQLQAGMDANMVHIARDGSVGSVWLAGHKVI